MIKLWLWRVGVFPQFASPTVFLFPFPAHKSPPLFSMIIISEAPKSNNLTSTMPESSSSSSCGIQSVSNHKSQLVWYDMIWSVFVCGEGGFANLPMYKTKGSLEKKIQHLPCPYEVKTKKGARIFMRSTGGRRAQKDSKWHVRMWHNHEHTCTNTNQN